MKKWFAVMAAMILAVAALATVETPAAAEAPIRIMVNGKYLTNMDVGPVGMNGRVFVPARFVAEALGATVDWDQQNRTVVIVSRPAAAPKWGREKGVWSSLTDSQVQDALLYGIANKDKTFDEAFKGYVQKQTSWASGGLSNTAILVTEWQDTAWWSWYTAQKGEVTPTVDQAKGNIKPGYLKLVVWLWGDTQDFAGYIEAYLKQGNQIIKPVETQKNYSTQGTGYSQVPGIPAAYATNVYLFSTNGLDLSASLDALVLSAAGQENRFTWNLYDLK